MKRKKPNFDNNDTNKISSYSSVPNTKNVNPKYYSATISFVETAVIPQLIHSLDNQNEKTFLYSKRLRKIFKPLWMPLSSLLIIIIIKKNKIKI